MAPVADRQLCCLLLLALTALPPLALSAQQRPLYQLLNIHADVRFNSLPLHAATFWFISAPFYHFSVTFCSIF